MYREIAGTDERVRAIPGVRDRRVRATKVRLYLPDAYIIFKAARTPTLFKAGTTLSARAVPSAPLFYM